MSRLFLVLVFLVTTSTAFNFLHATFLQRSLQPVSVIPTTKLMVVKDDTPLECKLDDREMIPSPKSGGVGGEEFKNNENIFQYVIRIITGAFSSVMVSVHSSTSILT